MKNLIIKVFMFLLLCSSCSDDFVPSDKINSKIYTSTKLSNTAIYYGWLNSLNSSTLGWNNANVINFINQYDIIVVGAGLEDSSDYESLNLS